MLDNVHGVSLYTSADNNIVLKNTHRSIRMAQPLQHASDMVIIIFHHQSAFTNVVEM